MKLLGQPGRLCQPEEISVGRCPSREVHLARGTSTLASGDQCGQPCVGRGVQRLRSPSFTVDAETARIDRMDKGAGCDKSEDEMVGP